MKNKGFGALTLGFFAGLLNGLLGAGGGIILVRGAEKVMPREYHDSRDVFANALCVMLPLSAVSALAYVLRGSVHGLEFAPFILPARGRSDCWRGFPTVWAARAADFCLL